MITVYSAWADDYSGLGLCALMPTTCEVKETAGGTFQLDMVHPMDGTGRWWNLLKYNVIKAPCPVRETPKINIAAGAVPGQTVVRKVYTVRVNTRLRLRTKPSTSTGKIIGRYKNGVEVLRIGASGDWYEVIVKKGGATGWMHSSYLRYVRDETEIIPGNDTPGVVIEPRETREQLFRIREVQRDDAAQTVHVTAWHVSYDVAGWVIKGEYSPEGVPAATALSEIVSRAKANDEYSFFCTATGEVTGEFQGRGLISAILENDGIAAQANARVVRDNFDFFILEDETRDKGVRIRHKKNLTGAILSEDVTNVATRVIPVGKTKEGEPLYLDGKAWVECPGASEIPIVSEKEIQYDVKVGDKGFGSTAKARAELRRLAGLEFAQNGLHVGMTGLDVDFEILEKTQPFAVVENYAALQSVSLYDTVGVISARSGIYAKLRVTGYVYDCILRRYKEVILGDLQELDTGISGYDITGDVSGTKIISGSVDGSKLRNLSIQYAKIAQAAIERLSADSITALEARIGKIVAGNVTTDTLYAAMAEIVTLMVKSITAETIETDELYAALADVILLRAQQIDADSIKTDTLAAQYSEIFALLADNITAGSIEADRLGASLARFVSMYAGVGEFDFATVQNLVAQAMALQQGSMDSVYIRNLAVTSANLLSATLGKLILKGDDGQYYRVYITADGEIRSETVTMTDGEITAGQTGSGLQIVETTANIGSLNAANIQGSSAVINQILTAALTAEKITAADALIASATIPTLYVTAVQAIGNSIDFSANHSIRMMVGRKNATLYREDEPEEFNSGDTWIRPSDGKTFLARGMTGKNAPELEIGEDFMLFYRFGDDADEYALMMDEDGNLLATDSHAHVTDEGDLEATSAWMEIAPSELHTSFIDIMRDLIVIHSGGNVNINAGGTLNVNSGAAHFRTGEYTLSILANDGTEDTVMDFDAEGRTLRVSELKAGNVRPFIAGTTEVTSGSIGGMDGLKGLLESARYEHLIYTQTSGDASSEPVRISGCDSLQVEILADLPTRVPPLIFEHATGNVYMQNLVWSCAGQTALTADSGSFVLRDCKATADTGVKATRHARVIWIGADDTATDGGACTTAFEATEGGEIRAFGLIPSGVHVQTLAGVVTVTNSSTGSGSADETEEQTVTLTGTLGYYGTNNGWNSSVMYQGYSNGKGRIYGCMRFTLPDGVTNIKAATLTLHRVSGAGSGSNINVSIYGSATDYGSRPSLGSLYASREKAAATGASCTLDVTQAAQALADGTVKQLVLWTGESAAASGVVYSRHYGKFDSAKLKITY